MQNQHEKAYKSLAAAVVGLAVFDLESTDPVIRRDAVQWINGDGFDQWLTMAGVQIGVDECRAALRRRGLLP
jgi:threonine dehydrogenase-like Zn-dependent dehydrogenase